MEDGGFEQVFRQRDYVYLGKGGIEKISEDRFEKGIKTLIDYKTHLDRLNVAKVKINGTETLRVASNGAEFLKKTFEKTGLKINIIGGLEEAHFIYLGVIHYFNELKGDHLIMDIGGGSVEFVHFNEAGKIWSHSFPIGITVLATNFQNNDPLSEKDVKDIYNYVDERISILKNYAKQNKLTSLIGSAGSFEIIRDMLDQRDVDIRQGFTSEVFIRMYEDFKSLDENKRLEIPGLPAERVELMPVAMVLLKSILELLNIETVMVSAYSMKEGILVEMLGEL